jgi:hypothetical protein
VGHLDGVQYEGPLLPSGFGSKRRKTSSCKPSKALIKEAKKRGIKVTLKRGCKRVYKSEALLKKQLK